MASNKLFVGGLSWGTTEDGMREAFEAHGDVTEVKIVVDRDTGRSKGFGFVSFADESDAATAKEAMNGAELDGRSITVDEARDRPPRRGGGGGGGYGGGGGGGRGGYGGGGGGGGGRSRW